MVTGSAPLDGRNGRTALRKLTLIYIHPAQCWRDWHTKGVLGCRHLISKYLGSILMFLAQALTFSPLPTPHDITFSMVKLGHVVLNIFSTAVYSWCDGLSFTTLTCSFCTSVHSLGSSIDCISAKQKLHYYDRQLAQLHRHILQTTCIERTERTAPSAILHSTSTLTLPNITGSVIHCKGFTSCLIIPIPISN